MEDESPRFEGQNDKRCLTAPRRSAETLSSCTVTSRVRGPRRAKARPAAQPSRSGKGFRNYGPALVRRSGTSGAALTRVLRAKPRAVWARRGPVVLRAGGVWTRSVRAGSPPRAARGLAPGAPQALASAVANVRGAGPLPGVAQSRRIDHARLLRPSGKGGRSVVNVLSDPERRVGVLTSNLHPQTLHRGSSVQVPGVRRGARGQCRCVSATSPLLVTFYLHKPGPEQISPQNKYGKEVCAHQARRMTNQAVNKCSDRRGEPVGAWSSRSSPCPAKCSITFFIFRTLFLVSSM